MIVTYNWLQDFVDIRLSPEQLADKLTLAGLEVVSCKHIGGDVVFEIEITSNRPDWLSVYGVAREVAAITGEKLKLGDRCSVLGTRAKHPAPSTKNLITIQDKKDCPYYSYRIIRNLQIKPSAADIARRLELANLRSVNCVVDLTNYLLFETGQPMHAFDLDKLSLEQGIIVRRATQKEKLVTIDGIERQLNPDILVIADNLKPLAIAGVMGGKDTEVTSATKNILLETAVFDSILVRRMRQKLALQSEAAYRFERGVDLAATPRVSLECASLIAKCSNGKLAEFKESGSKKIADRYVTLETDLVNRALGIQITAKECKSILTALGFTVKNKSASLQVKIPSFRQDVKKEVDLIEEVARIYGFDRILSSLPKISPQQASVLDLTAYLKEILFALGLNETITYSLIDKASLTKLKINLTPVEIRNPLSKEQEILRPTILTGLLNCVAHNLNQKQNQISLFEIAKIFHADDRANPVEQPVLGIALCGERTLLLDQGVVKDVFGLLHMKGILETVFSRLGIKGFAITPLTVSKDEFIIQAGAQELGRVFLPADAQLDAFEIKNKKVFLAQLDLTKLFSLAQMEKKFLPAAKYPQITRDMSFIVKDDLAVSRILEAISALGQPLENVKIVDYYRGKQIPKGFRALTISCIYRSNQRTLTEEDVSSIQEKAVRLLVDSFGVKMR
ncbi:MAG: phenylalanine--tRNA ligase subunit beta [Candidatus Omnitrophica bacterium]|jgi:phenylalanyl-tRNA synthetase beta chain|nr:phenylalanine--tRNA ligase subunit beta [Candidatus Omnitrophota bacterium]